MASVQCEDKGVNLADLVERIERMAADGAGAVGIVGAPGAGKTTLAEQLLALLNRGEPNPEGRLYAHVPMDGFHLSDGELSRLGLSGTQGRPRNF